MALPDGIEAAPPQGPFVNRHLNFEQTLDGTACFRLTIPRLVPLGIASYRQTTANFQWLIQYGIDNNVRLRALGANWSFTKVGISEGGIIDTVALRQTFSMSDPLVEPAYVARGGRPDNLWFTECGKSILALERDLEARGKSVKASGASNGQTIAGATSTGTHGAAFNVGAVHDTIVGLHLVCGPNRHVWLERASNPVVTPAFTSWLQVTEVLRDDDLFNAAVVSFGSFGFIHGVLLEVEDKFLVDDYSVKQVPFDQGLRRAMQQLDFTALQAPMQLPVPTADSQPWHFQLIINPHQLDVSGTDPARGCYVRIYYHSPMRPGYQPHQPPSQGYTYGDDTMGIINVVLDTLGAAVPALVPALVNKLYPLALEDSNGTSGTMSETFSNTDIRGKASSAAIGIAAHDSPRVVEEIVKLNQQYAFPGILGLRYVKGTAATLGFTRFPLTCVLELDGIESKPTRAFLQRIWDLLENLGIAYTLHWGKVNFNLNPARLRRMYGDDKVESWLQARYRLLDAPTRAVFTNGFMEQCGLDQPPAILPASPAAIT
jgi:hypothetical protein